MWTFTLSHVLYAPSAFCGYRFTTLRETALLAMKLLPETITYGTNSVATSYLEYWVPDLPSPAHLEQELYLWKAGQPIMLLHYVV